MNQQAKRLILIAVLGGLFFTSCKKDEIEKMKSSGEIKIEKIFNATTAMAPSDRMLGLTYHDGYLYTNSVDVPGEGYKVTKINTSDYSFERVNDLMANGNLSDNNFEYYDGFIWSFEIVSYGLSPTEGAFKIRKCDTETFEMIEYIVDSLDFGGTVNGVTVNSDNSTVYINTEDMLYEFNQPSGLTLRKEDQSGYYFNKFCFGKNDKIFEWHDPFNGGKPKTFLEYDNFENDNVSRKFDIPSEYSYELNSLVYAGEDVFFAAAYNHTTENYELIKITLP